MIVCAGALSFLAFERKAGPRPGMGNKNERIYMKVVIGFVLLFILEIPHMCGNNENNAIYYTQNTAKWLIYQSRWRYIHCEW